MNKITIVCVDDQREVLDTISRDLQSLESHVELEECESPQEALELMDEIDARGDRVALIISDHVMPETSGVEFLTQVRADERFSTSRKVLLTGLATHQDTITAINQAGIDHYIEKPWQKDDLLRTAKQLLTRYILDSDLGYQSCMECLDQEVLFRELRKQS